MAKFTYEEVLDALKEVVREHGEEHRYEQGFTTDHKKDYELEYSYDDCIVGCVVRKLDPELHMKMLENEAHYRKSFAWDEKDVVPSIRLLLEEFTTDKGHRLLNSAQMDQDLGETFGTALSDSVNVVRYHNEWVNSED